MARASHTQPKTSLKERRVLRSTLLTGIPPVNLHPGASVSAIGQTRPAIIEIKGLKTSHFKEGKTAPWNRGEIGSIEHGECPQSESADNGFTAWHGPTGASFSKDGRDPW